MFREEARNRLRRWTALLIYGVAALTVATPTLTARSVQAEPPQPSTRMTLATRIVNSGKVDFATWHTSGVRDAATAKDNIVQTMRGHQAQRSRYGTAPGGAVYLDERMLEGMLALSRVYTFTVTEIAGGSHSRNSRHYAGVAFDVGTINGQQIRGGSIDVTKFMAACRRKGAIEVLGPGDPDHDTHIHCAWSRP